MKSRILITLCIASGILFIFSGLSKLFPAELFELTLVKAQIVNWNYSPYLARFIIAVELFLGIALLQKNYIRLIIGGAIVLLAVFSLHLAYTIYITGNTGNCGCFGELLPMSPLSALIKNIIMLIILDYTYIQYKNENKGSLYLPVAILVFSFIIVLLISPIQSYQTDKEAREISKPGVFKIDTTSLTAPNEDQVKTENKIINKEKQIDEEVNKTKEKNIVVPLMNKNQSEFKDFHIFSDSVYVDLDSGIKIAALLSLDCEHCMAAAKEIVTLSEKMKLPPVYFLYLGEPEQLPAFYSNTGANDVPFKIINARTFFTLLKESPPRIVLLNNGNIMGDWGSKDFSTVELRNKLNKK